MKRFIAGLALLLAGAFGTPAQNLTVDVSTPGFHKILTKQPMINGNLTITNIPYGYAVFFDLENENVSALTLSQVNFYVIDDINSTAASSQQPVNCMSNTGQLANSSSLFAMGTPTQQFSSLTVNNGFHLLVTCSVPAASEYVFAFAGNCGSTCSGTNVEMGVYTLPNQSTVGGTTNAGSAQGSTLAANVSGVQSENGSATGINPVYVAGLSGGANVHAFELDANGAMFEALLTGQGDGSSLNNSGGYSIANGASEVFLKVNPFIASSGQGSVVTGEVLDREMYCGNNASISGVAATTTQVIPLSASTRIRICTVIVSNNSATATNFSLTTGTGTNCGTGTATLLQPVVFTANTGSYPSANLAFNSNSPLIAPSGAALCVTGSAAGSLNVTVIYAQY